MNTASFLLATGKLQIDHVDNNPYNWKPKNLHLLCQKHNLEMRELTTDEHKKLIELYSAKNVCVRESELGSLASKQVKGFADYQRGSEEMKVNSLCERIFTDWLLNYIRKYHFILKQEAINSGAYVAGCTVATIHRYLAPLTSMLGPLRETRDETGTAIISFREQPKRKSTKKKSRSRL